MNHLITAYVKCRHLSELRQLVADRSREVIVMEKKDFQLLELAPFSWQTSTELCSVKIKLLDIGNIGELT